MNDFQAHPIFYFNIYYIIRIIDFSSLPLVEMTKKGVSGMTEDNETIKTNILQNKMQ